MTIATLLRGGLIADAGVAALVGTRVYPGLLPQKPTYEAITYERVSNTGQDGSSNRKQSRWQINCWGATYAEAHVLANAVKAALEEWHDVDHTPGIERARVVNEIDDYDDNVEVYRVIVDVMLHTIGD